MALRGRASLRRAPTDGWCPSGGRLVRQLSGWSARRPAAVRGLIASILAVGAGAGGRAGRWWLGSSGGL